MRRTVAWAGALFFCALLAGCAGGPVALQQTRLQYNEVVKATTEQQLLLNIVRLRYTDTPSSLSIANIAAQFELIRQLQLTPFFVASGAEPNRSFSTVLPQAGMTYADRPTFSLVPIDDAEFTRKLFTPLTLDGVLYLAKTTWPIGTVFRLYLENLNWVPNAEFASGPTPDVAPKYSDFLVGILALQNLQQQGRVVFSTEERFEVAGGPIPAAQVNAASVIEAAKNGLELRPDEGGATWTLGRKTRQPVIYFDPASLDSSAMREFVRIFRLKPGQTKYDVTVDSLVPFSDAGASGGLTLLDLESRSLLQAMYYVSHGVEVPPEHAARGIARGTRTEDGSPFDWLKVTEGVFRTHWSKGDEPPAGAHTAVSYQGYWFYIGESDHETKATFSLLMELTRLDLQAKPGDRPVLTLPISR
ncbi:MAG TPA: hypothetical protein VMU46_05710 [Burkholderiales bacterium]|nr:hypothetical protein [Burkholderiales bacterium]